MSSYVSILHSVGVLNLNAKKLILVVYSHARIIPGRLNKMMEREGIDSVFTGGVMAPAALLQLVVPAWDGELEQDIMGTLAEGAVLSRCLCFSWPWTRSIPSSPYIIYWECKVYSGDVTICLFEDTSYQAPEPDSYLLFTSVLSLWAAKGYLDSAACNLSLEEALPFAGL